MGNTVSVVPEQNVPPLPDPNKAIKEETTNIPSIATPLSLKINTSSSTSSASAIPLWVLPLQERQGRFLENDYEIDIKGKEVSIYGYCIIYLDELFICLFSSSS